MSNFAAPQHRPLVRSAANKAKPSHPVGTARKPNGSANPIDRFEAATIGSSTALEISSPNDPGEKEAEAIAHEVVDLARPGAFSPTIRRQVPSSVNLWRACAKCDEEERQAHRPGGGAKGLIQRRCDTCDQGARETSATNSERNGARPTLSPDVRKALFRDMRAGGEPLDSATRQFMEPRFQRDFSGVRIHKTSASAELAETLNARAFTLGRDVFFGRNEYQPSTQTGKRLLAHELTHTLQQGSGASLSRARIQRAPASEASESVTPAPGSSPGPTAEPSNSDCPARDPDERRWAREQPLQLDYELMPSRFGHDLRVWTLTGFPIDSTFPGPTQGDVISLLLPLFKRLHYLGTALDDQANSGLDILTENMEPPRCAKLYRSVRVFGVGDCHGPERNISLKKGRAAFLEMIWPASLRGLFRRGDEGMARKDEARFGEFPAGSNATREARAQNRGVVLVEDFRAEEYSEGEHQDALARRQLRTDAVFPQLYREALDTIPDGSIRKCILSKVRFAGGRPINTDADEYILDRDAHKVFVGRRVLTSNHVGASVYSMARSWNIMSAKSFGSPDSICGDKREPASEPLLKMRSIMEQVTNSVMSGSAQINAAIQTYDVSTRDWLVNNVETGGVYECMPSPTDMFSALELLNPKNISDAIKSRFGLE